MEEIILGVKTVGPHAKVPTYATPRSSGADVVNADVDFTLRPGERRLVHTGVYLQIPDGYEVQVRSRSGLALKRGVIVLNAPGTIDSDYQGECNIILMNCGTEPWECKVGERIAQFVLSPVVRAVFQGMLAFEEETSEEQEDSAVRA